MEVPITISMTISRSTTVEVPEGYSDVDLYNYSKEQGLHLSDKILYQQGWNIDECEVIKDL